MMVPSRLQNVVITPQNNMYFSFPREDFYDLAHLVYPVIYHK